MIWKVTFRSIQRQVCIMNPFEQYTLVIGLLAIAFEGVSYIREFIQKIFHKT